MTKVYSNINEQYQNLKFLSVRAILSPKILLWRPLTSEKYSPESVTSIFLLKWNFPVLDPSESLNYPNEFSNSLNSSRPPHHKVDHKVDHKVCSPIILLRYPDPLRPCNRTRIVVREIMPHLIEATIVPVCGNDVFIPRIYLIPIDVKILFKGLQLPVKLSFAMSIDK